MRALIAFAVLALSLFLSLYELREPRLDASSHQALEHSLKRLERDIPESDRLAFAQDYGVVFSTAILDHIGYQATSDDLRRAMENDPDGVFTHVHAQLDGLTAGQIRALAAEKRQRLEHWLNQLDESRDTMPPASP
ncbi:MAG: hypothetical protein R3296_15375 [Oleiphilaceae bacterium]|nr:hypothetical protein [Oleiphilaceae bacterium]